MHGRQLATACFEHCALKPVGESVCFDMFEDDAGDSSISDVPGDKHPPDLRSFFIKRPMCAHANGTSRGESNEVSSSRLCGRVGRRGRSWVVKLRVQQLNFTRSFAKQGQGFGTLWVGLFDGELQGAELRASVERRFRQPMHRGKPEARS